MTQIQTLLEHLQERGYSVHLGDGSVQIRGENISDEETKALIHELRKRREEVRQALASDDPILPVEAWYPVFKEFHLKVVHETRDFDYGWVRANRLDLYRSLKEKEAELDSLRDARLSEVMAVMREWRILILKSEFERMEANKPQPEQRDLKLRTG